jgi:KDO2-lipid IV(A) lauroyltransferase
VVFTIARVLLGLGIERSIRLAAIMGRLGYYALIGISRTTLKNLRISLGSTLTRKQRVSIAKTMMSNFAVSAIETAWLSKWRTLFSWTEITWDGLENLEAAYQKGRGVICLNAHFGNWEVMTVAVAKLGYPCYIVARRQKDPRLDRWIGGIRTQSGAVLIIRGETPFAYLRTLRQGGLLGMMVDLDTRSNEGIFVDFFGRPTYTQIGPFVLARRTGAPLVLCLCFREGLNRLRFYFSPPWEIPQTDDPAQDIRQAVIYSSQCLETQIRNHPEQWAWFHRRWKTTPEKIAAKERDRESESID